MTGARNVKKVTRGEFKMTAREYKTAQDKLELCVRVLDALGAKKSFARCDYITAAVGFCHVCDEVSDERLVEKVEKYANLPDMLRPCVSLEQTVAELTRIYNYRNKDKVLIDYEYKKWRMEK